jgi:hypothetical protein
MLCPRCNEDDLSLINYTKRETFGETFYECEFQCRQCQEIFIVNLSVFELESYK